MVKNINEIRDPIRDPIHVFIRLLNGDERKVLDSRPLQRLRNIHQLALTYQVYPGATHKRFEHSLGVMELASRVFDVITHPDNVTDIIRESLPEIRELTNLPYWKFALRMAALCHDIGHLSFSHAAEKELLPEGWDHERLTQEIILGDEMKAIWEKVTPPLKPELIVKLAIGPKKASDLEFTTWETILSEIIVGDAFGVDRMDYLLRDSHHTGVAYGKFDHYRLIDTLRILPQVSSEKEQIADGTHFANGSIDASGKKNNYNEPVLGVEEGGLQSAEALMLARYFMYSQVYFHRVRRIYDIHLKDFLKSWLPKGSFSTEIDEHLAMTDNEINAALYQSVNAESIRDLAKRITQRQHFKVLYQSTPMDTQINRDSGLAVFNAAKLQFGEDKFRHDSYSQEGGAPDFPVKMRDGKVISSLALSSVLCNMPVVSTDYVFAERGILSNAQEWLSNNHDKIIQPKIEEAIDGQA